jgi:hypothetical protein
MGKFSQLREPISAVLVRTSSNLLKQTGLSFSGRPLPSSGGMTSSRQTPPLIKEKAPFQNTYKSEKNKKYGHGSQRGLVPKPTVLAKASSNLQYLIEVSLLEVRVDGSS